MNIILTIILAVVLLLTIFSLVAYVIMITYNNSIVKLNQNWKPMDFKAALFFTLFTSMIFRTPTTNMLSQLDKIK